jgi:hypothetical protein
MLKTNSKKALGNIRAYILENADDTNFGGNCNFADWKAAARFVYDCFRAEKDGDNRRMAEYALFEEWASGLPSAFDFCYWYNRPALDDLGAILEETEEEKARFSESKAEKLLTTLIYNQIKKAVA